MRVGFDLRPAYRANSRRRGIGKVCRRQLLELMKLDQGPEVTVLTEPGTRPDLPGRHRLQSVAPFGSLKRLTWLTDLFVLPLVLGRAELDLFHATDITSIPKLSKTPVLATVYDLIPLLFQEEYRPVIPWDYRQALRVAFRRIRSADRVITCSEHSRRDICERLDVDESRVSVVHLACDESFRPMEQELCRRRLRERYQLREPFLFYVGGSDFRKNLPFLIRAFAQIRRNGYDGKLVLAGETFLWDLGETRLLRQEAVRQGVLSEVVFPGFVEDSDLPYFYGACDLFVFPSLYEGFGIPVLEALQSGAPVLAAKTSSMPEVAGQAAIFFDPRDEASLVDGFERLHGDPARRDSLRQAGFQQAARFGWRKTASVLCRLYRETADRTGRPG